MSLQPISASLEQVGRQSRRVHRDDLRPGDLLRCHDAWWKNERNRSHIEHAVATVKARHGKRAAVTADRAKHLADLLVRWTDATTLEVEISRERLQRDTMMTAGQLDAAFAVLTEAGQLETVRHARKREPRSRGWAARRRLRYLLKARARYELTTKYTDADADAAFAPDVDDLEQPPPVDRALHGELHTNGSACDSDGSPWHASQFSVQPAQVMRARHTPLQGVTEELHTAHDQNDDDLAAASPVGAGDSPASHNMADIDAELDDALERSRAEPW